MCHDDTDTTFSTLFLLASCCSYSDFPHYAMQMESMDKELRSSRLSEQLNKHYAAIAIVKGFYSLSLRLTDD